MEQKNSLIKINENRKEIGLIWRKIQRNARKVFQRSYTFDVRCQNIKQNTEV